MSVFHRTAGKAEDLGHPAKLKSQKSPTTEVASYSEQAEV